ncbi:MAG: hypothetical protein RLZZ293_1113 [Pseudomonadota bacterium]|jgi:hypothetical protein
MRTEEQKKLAQKRYDESRRGKRKNIPVPIEVYEEIQQRCLEKNITMVELLTRVFLYDK